jgi:hypothetical protein
MNLPDSSKSLAGSEAGQADLPKSSIDRIAVLATLPKPQGKPYGSGCFSYLPAVLATLPKPQGKPLGSACFSYLPGEPSGCFSYLPEEFR